VPRIAQKKAIRGSQKWLQFLDDTNRQALDGLLRTGLRLNANDRIEWLSPLEEDDYAEYQDEAFLERLSVRLEKRSLRSFWPRRGPVWDGLAKTNRGDIILVEAKSHVSELSSSCQAKQPSLDLIRSSLKETAGIYGAGANADWLNGYYQYANRLAHLYLLRHLNNLPAWLVFVYFVNDVDMNGPESEDEWRLAIETMHAHLGVAQERLRPHVVDAFIDVKAMA
jgi:hypothetical protein